MEGRHAISSQVLVETYDGPVNIVGRAMFCTAQFDAESRGPHARLG